MNVDKVVDVPVIRQRQDSSCSCGSMQILHALSAEAFERISTCSTCVRRLLLEILDITRSRREFYSQVTRAQLMLRCCRHGHPVECPRPKQQQQAQVVAPRGPV